MEINLLQGKEFGGVKFRNQEVTRHGFYLMTKRVIN
jgi:hypothetical protein